MVKRCRILCTACGDALAVKRPPQWWPKDDLDHHPVPSYTTLPKFVPSLFLRFIQCRSLFRILDRLVQQHGRIVLIGSSSLFYCLDEGRSTILQGRVSRFLENLRDLLLV